MPASMNRDTRRFPPVPVVRAAFGCRCPRCGEGALFVIFFLGLIVVGLAAWVELRFGPPLWLHMMLWIPLILGGAILMLRPLKAGLIALQYRHNLLHHPPS